ncbi:MAG: hypothetical protein WCJ60_02170 [bacterium]
MPRDNIKINPNSNIGTINVAGKSVLYLINSGSNLDILKLVIAQKTALDNKLPIAVVYFVSLSSINNSTKEGIKALKNLISNETMLNKFNIPLMVIIGDIKDKLHSLMHHTQPKAVYFNNVTTAKDQQELTALFSNSELIFLDNFDQKVMPLQKHLIDWKGPVIPINDLIKIIDKLINNSN